MCVYVYTYIIYNGITPYNKHEYIYIYMYTHNDNNDSNTK